MTRKTPYWLRKQMENKPSREEEERLAKFRNPYTLRVHLRRRAMRPRTPQEDNDNNEH